MRTSQYDEQFPMIQIQLRLNDPVYRTVRDLINKILSEMRRGN